jgi:hypothetical protein
MKVSVCVCGVWCVVCGVWCVCVCVCVCVCLCAWKSFPHHRPPCLDHVQAPTTIATRLHPAACVALSLSLAIFFCVELCQRALPVPMQCFAPGVAVKVDLGLWNVADRYPYFSRSRSPVSDAEPRFGIKILFAFSEEVSDQPCGLLVLFLVCCVFVCTL